MEYIYAALLLDAAGKELNEENIKSVIKAAGMAPDEAMAKSVVSSLKGVNIKEVIKNAQVMQAAPAAAAGAAPATPPAPRPARWTWVPQYTASEVGIDDAPQRRSHPRSIAICSASFALSGSVAGASSQALTPG